MRQSLCHQRSPGTERWLISPSSRRCTRSCRTLCRARLSLPPLTTPLISPRHSRPNERTRRLVGVRAARTAQAANPTASVDRTSRAKMTQSRHRWRQQQSCCADLRERKSVGPTRAARSSWLISTTWVTLFALPRDDSLRGCRWTTRRSVLTGPRRCAHNPCLLATQQRKVACLSLVFALAATHWLRLGRSTHTHTHTHTYTHTHTHTHTHTTHTHTHTHTQGRGTAIGGLDS
jgi:hypothetical protein